MMLLQAEIALKEYSDHCVLFDESGEKVDEKTDARMEFHFNAMLDINNQMRKDKTFTTDASLFSKCYIWYMYVQDEQIFCA